MQESAKGGPIPRFAHDIRDPWHLVPKAYLTAGGVTEACGPRRCTKLIASSGNKIEGRVISACIRPLPHYMYHLQVYIVLKTQKGDFSDAAERNNNRKYA